MPQPDSAGSQPVSPQRAASLAALAQRPFDLMVIGGGIVGAGVARDAAMRGLRVCLVEQHDFAFGTSSRSSRLLHGGLRYLAQGRIGLVHEASVEKKIIHQIAPHLADPLPFVFPTYAENKNWRLWQLKIGVKIYDLLCGGRNLGKSSWLGAEEVLEKIPGLRVEGLTGAVRYFDGFTNDARLVLDTLRSAAKHGALLANYCAFENATEKSGWECRVVDKLSGQSHLVHAQAVVNATGPWADGLPHSEVKLRISKGVHLVVERSRVPVPETVVMTEEKRILFAIPWGDRTILGTTDTDYKGSLEVVNVEAEDVEYLLRIANHFFPQAKLTPSHVIGSWAGLRPLIADPHGRPSDISRSHQIRSPEPGWWDVAGGKLTTYRLMAEQTVDRMVTDLRRSDALGKAVGPCRTATEPLLTPQECEGVSGILPPRFDRDVVRHFCAAEWAVHLDDVMVRRSRWHYYDAAAANKAEAVAVWMGDFLGWSESIRAAELERYCRLAAGKVSILNA